VPSVFYPAIVERAESGFSVFFPDLPGCTSAGETMQAAALAAEEALGEHVVLSVEHGETLAEPSEIDNLVDDPEIVEVCRILVRAETPGRALRINITLDEALIAAIDRVAPNRSGFLAEAARDTLRRRQG
jgi:predicted RNase H-like HicB family nuclease